MLSASWRAAGARLPMRYFWPPRLQRHSSIAAVSCRADTSRGAVKASPVVHSAVLPLPLASFASCSMRTMTTMTTTASVHPVTRLVADGTLSHVVGASTPELTGLTIGDALDALADSPSLGGKLALCVLHQDVEWTWLQLRDYADAYAHKLTQEWGLKPGDRVGAWLGNCWEYTLLQMACAKAGLILVTVNPQYSSAELKYALNLVEMNALVLNPRIGKGDSIAKVKALLDQLPAGSPSSPWYKQVFPSLAHIFYTGAHSVQEFESIGMRHFGSLAQLRSISPAKPFSGFVPSPHFAANIQFTSGTTGSPKATTLSHHNILNNGKMVGHFLNLTPDDKVCIPVPLYHCFGLVMGNLACLSYGATMVLPALTFDPEATLKAVARLRCTALYGVPTMFIVMLESPNFASYNLASLRTGIMAGSSCPIKVMATVREKMHMRDITICYGMTETSPVSFQTQQNDPVDKRVETVGRVHPHVEVKIVNVETLEPVPVGQVGEILTRGYSVMKGYWNDVNSTLKAIIQDRERAEHAAAVEERDPVAQQKYIVAGLGAGWMRTGDLGVLDSEGYCRIVGRSKDMIIRGGENIFPREIEEVLFKHPLVLSVAVVGIPDEKYGEIVLAAIVPNEGKVLEWLAASGDSKLLDEFYSSDQRGQSDRQSRPDHSQHARHRHHREKVTQHIRAHCKEVLAPFKIPAHFVYMRELPMTVTGKIQKFVLRDEVMKRMGMK